VAEADKVPAGPFGKPLPRLAFRRGSASACDGAWGARPAAILAWA
jgi:hypothetical protein